MLYTDNFYFIYHETDVTYCIDIHIHITSYLGGNIEANTI